MANISGTHLCVYISGLALVMLLLCIFSSKYITFDNSDNPYIVENLDIPNVASSGDVSTGSSELYGWGYTPITKNTKRKMKKRNCSSCENTYIDEIDLCFTCNGGNKDCRFADITQNVDIDKYVLKSTVPSCPDLSEYAKKNQIPPLPYNPNEWIRKNEIPPCKRCPDMRNYINKSELEAHICGCGGYKRDTPQCPICPVAPQCPPCSDEKINYINKQNIISNYSQSDYVWTPKLSELNEGFINF